MAPMAVSHSHPLKRTSSSATFDNPPAKKLNRRTLRHHKIRWDIQREQRLESSWHNDESAQSLLTRSISLALEAVGFEAADPDAIESFRGDVEEYMVHYLADVRQSMLSCRRTQPIPQDFLQALHTHQLSLRSLLPHLDPPVPASRSVFPLQPTPAKEDEQQQLPFLGPLLNDAPNEQVKTHVPKHFPALPSKHTYKATPEVPEREQDPRKLRERATEEGRLGEEALRRLVSAGSRHPAHDAHQASKSKSLRARRDQMWLETMKAVTAGGPNEMEIDKNLCTVMDKGNQKEGDVPGTSFGDGRLGSAVNSEKIYWRKPAPPRRDANGII